MTMREYFLVLRGHWRIVLGGLVLGVLVAAGVTALRPPEYSATATVFVSARPDRTGAKSALDAHYVVMARMKTYAAMARSEQVASEVAGLLGPGSSAEVLPERITTVIRTDTNLLGITATEDSPEQAARTANLVTQRVIAHISRLEDPADGLPSIVVGKMFEEARPALSPTEPRPLFNSVLGVVLGLLIGFAVALNAHAPRRFVPAPERAA